MKINNTVIRDTNFQFDNNDKCKISNNGAIFQILSSKLYSDKFNSIVREISSNMYDSHKAANKLDVPFEINLTYEYIEFKDFGVGLSEEEIEQIYKVYFNSTKSADNDFIGGFGLGSKTPFAYTNIFNIISKKNGKKLEYICFMDNQFQPNIKKINESEVDMDDTGFTVKFNIANTPDYNEFLSAIQHNFDYYKVKPLFNHKPLESSQNYNVSKKFIKEFDSFKYELSLVSNYNYWNQNINIIVGNIKYDIDLTKLEGFDDRMFYNYILDIFIPVGSVSLTVNREKLEYDKNTVEFLKNCFALVKKDIINQLFTIYTTPKNIVERRAIQSHLGSITNNDLFSDLKCRLNEFEIHKYYYNKYSNRLQEYGMYSLSDEMYSSYSRVECVIYDDVNIGNNKKIFKILKEKLKDKGVSYFYILKSEPTEEFYNITGLMTVDKMSDFLGIQYEECIKIIKKVRKVNDNFRLINYLSGLQKTVKTGYIITTEQKNKYKIDVIKDFLKKHLNCDIFLYNHLDKIEIQELVKDKKLRFIMNNMKFSDLLNLYDGFLKDMSRYIPTSSNLYQSKYRTKYEFIERDFEEFIKYIDCIKDDKIQDDAIFVYNHIFNAYSPLNNYLFQQRSAFYNKIKSVLNKKIDNIMNYYKLFMDLKYHRVNNNILNNLYQVVNLNGNV